MRNCLLENVTCRPESRGECDICEVFEDRVDIREIEDEVRTLRAVIGGMDERRAEIGEAFDHLWGFWDGNTLVAIPGYQDDIQASFKELANAIGETRPLVPEAEEEHECSI